MPIKNYTSEVSPETTIARIERILVEAKATGIMKEYEGSEVSALSFQIKNPATKQPLLVRLPINHEAVYQILKKLDKRWENRKEERTRAQAMRTSWKLMQDWLEIQLSLIQMQQVELLQVFLPFIWNGKQTYYAIAKEQNFQLALPAPSSN